jgi:protocatechuate 3,4-dioxygenase alpha subunit
MTKTDTSRHEQVLPTPSHTVGPFYGYALPFEGGGEIAPAGHPETVALRGYIHDGAGSPLPDAFIEIWGPDPTGELPRVDGSMRRDPTTGGFLGRNGVEFTGWGRVQTDSNGHWAARTLRPGARGGNAPYLSVVIFGRGMTKHLFTRIYLGDTDQTALNTDPLLARLPDDRRETLIAHREESTGAYRFDIRLQGEDETVFLEFD